MYINSPIMLIEKIKVEVEDGDIQVSCLDGDKLTLITISDKDIIDNANEFNALCDYIRATLQDKNL